MCIQRLLVLRLSSRVSVQRLSAGVLGVTTGMCLSVCCVPCCVAYRVRQASIRDRMSDPTSRLFVVQWKSTSRHLRGDIVIEGFRGAFPLAPFWNWQAYPIDQLHSSKGTHHRFRVVRPKKSGVLANPSLRTCRLLGRPVEPTAARRSRSSS